MESNLYSVTRGKLNVITPNKDFVAISIKDPYVSYPPSSKLYCNLCSCNLTLLDAQKEEWFCTRWNVSYFPNKGQKVKRANKFETPGDKKTPIVAMVDDTAATTVRSSRSVFPRSLESLRRPGVKITEFHSTIESESL